MGTNSISYNNINNNNDAKRTSETEDSAIQDDSEINVLINNFREMTKDDLSERSFKSVVRKVVDKYAQGKVKNFREYLVTALTNKIETLELRRLKDNAKNQLDCAKKNKVMQQLETRKIEKEVLFYNWLEA